MKLSPKFLVTAGLLVGIVHGDDTDAADNSVLAARGTMTTLVTATISPAPNGNAVSAAPSTIPTYTIAVGATGFNFSPNNLTNVDVGSIIEFNFCPGNHSVVRSAFKFPCIPYEDTGPNRIGFFSGFQDTNVYSSDGPKYRVRVNDTEPIFYYCSAPGSCISHGMLGVINPNSTWTLETQEEYAANTTIQLTPGEPLPSEVSPTTVSSTGGASTAGKSSLLALSAGAIAGIVLGSLAGIITLIGLGVLVFCCLRRNHGWRFQRHRRLHNTSTGGAILSPMLPPGRASSTPVGAPALPLAVGTNLDMSDMGGYFTQANYRHRTPPLPLVPSHISPYNGTTSQFHRSFYGQTPGQTQTQAYGLPIYNSMATMNTLSPLQSHPNMGGVPGGLPTVYSAPAAAPSPFTDKDYYGTPPIPTPTPPTQQQVQAQQPAPVELPGAAPPNPQTEPVTELQPPPAPPTPTMFRIESPTIGGIDREWKEGEATELTQL
ncbi:hypothetical protein SEUCBS139899_008727 [Sporothrix eucalyptigena]